MSAFGGKADIARCTAHVSYQPFASRPSAYSDIAFARPLNFRGWRGRSRPRQKNGERRVPVAVTQRSAIFAAVVPWGSRRKDSVD